jgi:hypothetical protein
LFDNHFCFSRVGVVGVGVGVMTEEQQYEQYTIRHSVALDICLEYLECLCIPVLNDFTRNYPVGREHEYQEPTCLQTCAKQTFFLCFFLLGSLLTPACMPPTYCYLHGTEDCDGDACRNGYCCSCCCAACRHDLPQDDDRYVPMGTTRRYESLFLDVQPSSGRDIR